MLKRKKKTPNRDWLRVWRDIEKYVSRSEVNAATERAVARMAQVVAEKRCAFAWSGGKDSIVVGELARRAGVERGVFVHTNLEYPAFMQWVEHNIPPGVDTVNTGHGLEWLANNPRFLFSGDSAIRSRWYSMVQNQNVLNFAKRNSFDTVFLGRRAAEGNYMRQVGPVHNCIGDWSHELVLGFVYYNALPLPPFYDWPDGFVHGTHSWSMRNSKGRSVRDVWGEIYGIDSSIVYRAARHIPSAYEFIGGD